ncbi:hypothetical protein CEXT_611331 [Caerostris extrusa]|uniref:Uncharacterized protein n=1 Tax=Caerostris extrusa TaxID=172846 RepID=A0AAV4MIP3_CAEEX|nr:hypothetical protein CEXT_611331 [Caerostris extrusa]
MQACYSVHALGWREHEGFVTVHMHLRGSMKALLRCTCTSKHAGVTVHMRLGWSMQVCYNASTLRTDHAGVTVHVHYSGTCRLASAHAFRAEIAGLLQLH